MKRNDKTFKEMVSRIQSGELTRSQAADAYNIKVNTLNVWLGRSRLTVPKTRSKELRGAAVEWSNNVDYTALNSAVASVLDGTYKSCYAAQRAFPTVKLSTLTLKVRQARERMATTEQTHLIQPQDDHAKLVRVLGCMGVSLQDASLLSDIAGDPARLAKAAAVIRAAGI